jgi:copper chaperone CopZ
MRFFPAYSIIPLNAAHLPLKRVRTHRKSPAYRLSRTHVLKFDTQLHAGCPTYRSSFFLMQVGGMTCSSCTLAVEDLLLGQPGVITVAVSLLQAEAKVHYDPNEITEVSLLTAT